MGKRWDYDVPSVEVWAECLRVLKPGGHLLAFAGTRTQHRMACRIEDAGFEIRDMIAWVYGSGFPKSLDVSKAIDKRGGSVAGFEQFRDAVRAAMKRSGVSRSQLQAALGNHMLSHYLSAGSQPAVPNLRDYRIIRDTVRLGSEFDVLFADEAEREVVGQGSSAISTRKDLQNGKGTVWGADSSTFDITAPATPEAQQWAGWGTALKPALEPITMARKPLVGTVAANVLEHGTGALNVDGCRVATSDPLGGGGATTAVSDHWDRPFRHDPVAIELLKKTTAEKIAKAEQLGRWPANLIHDGSDEVVGLFPQTRSGGILPHHKRTTSKGKHNIGSGVGNGPLHAPVNGEHFPADTGSAARFFYTAKATQAERQGVTHPTVKPLDLMAYLCRLITPPGGVVLDPFMGSGTTIKAAIGEGFQAIGIERDPAYFAMAEHRMNGVQLGLALTAA
jgi:hypothetical protein